jgi:pilus assembly protein CpaF
VFSIVITERGGAQRQLDFEAPELSVGRLEDNDVVLPRSNVSKRHARIALKDDRYVLVDLKSTNGTYVNGRKITTPLLVGPGDKIYIGDFILALQDIPKPRDARRLDWQPTLPVVAAVSERPPADPLLEPGLGAASAELHAPGARRSAPPPPPSVPSPAERVPRAVLPPPPGSVAPGPSGPNARTSVPPPVPAAAMPTGVSAPPSSLPPPPPAPGAQRASQPSMRPSQPQPRVQDPDSGPATSPAVLAPSVRLQGALQTLMERLALMMDVAVPTERAFPSEHALELEALIDGLANEGVIGPDLDRRFLTQAAISEAVGLGPLDRLLQNRSVREVVVDGPSRILADLGGGLSPVSSFFSSAQAVQIALRRLCARAGRSLRGAPIEEIPLPDGGQLQVLLPPLSPHGPLISIRCPPRTATSADGLVTEGVLSMEMLAFLRTAMQQRVNALCVGARSAGVSTLLSAMASLCHDHERIVTLEDTPSLAIQHPHVLPLSARGAPEQSLGDLLRHAARLRPDRLVVDDLRGPDALEALIGSSAMRGVLVGMHAPSPAAALDQLEMFAQVALGGAHGSLDTLIAQAFQLLVHVSADQSGVRRVLQIAEIRGAHGGTLEVVPLFRYDGGFRAGDQRASFAGAIDRGGSA